MSSTLLIILHPFKRNQTQSNGNQTSKTAIIAASGPAKKGVLLLVSAALVNCGVDDVVVGLNVGVTTDGMATEDGAGETTDGIETGVDTGVDTGTETGATEVGTGAAGSGIDAGTDGIEVARTEVTGACVVLVGSVTTTVVGPEAHPDGHGFAVVVKPGGTPPDVVASAGQYVTVCVTALVVYPLGHTSTMDVVTIVVVVSFDVGSGGGVVNEVTVTVLLLLGHGVVAG